jgi:hypothetical protein
MRKEILLILAVAVLSGCGPIAETMDANLNSLTIRNRSGQTFSKLTVKRGKGAVLTMQDVTDGSSHETFLVKKNGQTQLVTLCAHLATGQTVSTNFMVTLPPEGLQDFDVEIDTALVFRVTAKMK